MICSLFFFFFECNTKYKIFKIVCSQKWLVLCCCCCCCLKAFLLPFSGFAVLPVALMFVFSEARKQKYTPGMPAWAGTGHLLPRVTW